MKIFNAYTSDILTMALYERSRHLPEPPIPPQAYGMGNNKPDNCMGCYGVIVFYFSILVKELRHLGMPIQ